MSAESRTPSMQFRRLRVEPYEPKEMLPGYVEDDELIDVSSFSGTRYVVTFEVREHENAPWREVRGEA